MAIMAFLHHRQRACRQFTALYFAPPSKGGRNGGIAQAGIATDVQNAAVPFLRPQRGQAAHREGVQGTRVDLGGRQGRFCLVRGATGHAVVLHPALWRRSAYQSGGIERLHAVPGAAERDRANPGRKGYGCRIAAEWRDHFAQSGAATGRERGMRAGAGEISTRAGRACLPGLDWQGSEKRGHRVSSGNALACGQRAKLAISSRQPAVQSRTFPPAAFQATPPFPAQPHSEPLVHARVQTLIHHLLLCQPNNYSDQLLRRPGTAPQRKLRVAEDYITSHLHEPLTLEAIANACGTGVRSLCAAFREHYQCAPMAYVRQKRLAAARSELMDAAPGTHVADIALRCGFSHLGRFSLSYRARYGETPL